MEFQLNLTKALDAVLAKKWIIIAVGAAALVLSFIFIDGSAPDLYSASTSIYATSSESYRAVTEGIDAMRDYIDVIRSRKVAERASAYLSQEVSAEEIMGMVTAGYSESSNIITVMAMSADPIAAISVANAVADAFIQEIVNITSIESIKVLDAAYTARITSDMSSQAMKYRLIAAAAAVIILAGLIAVAAAFDTRVAYPDEATLNGKIDLIGVIPDKEI